MKKTMIGLAALVALGMVSCKEYGVSIDGNDSLAEDTTYVTTPPPAEQKNFLMEELSGVRCGNCPEAAVFMEELNKHNNDRLKVIAIHVGHLARVITEREPKSIQNLAAEDGLQVVRRIFGELGNMPCISADRWRLGNGSNIYLVDGASNWPAKIAEMKAKRETTPVNVKVESKFNSAKEEYNITVTLNYTKAVTTANKLFVYLIENGIKDAFIEADTLITYNHVFRKAITDPDGRPILVNVSKEPGRVYIYRTALKIDKSDAIQRYWKPENMKVVAFVSNDVPKDVDAGKPEDQSVLQVQDTTLVN